MKEHNMNASGLGRHFWQQVTAQVLPGLNRTLGVWEDDQPQPHPDDLPKNAFGNIWQAQSTIKSAVDRKSQVAATRILSKGCGASAWDLRSLGRA
jgi:hypothetical protein